MSKLTSKQVSALAHDFLSFTQSIGNYIIENSESLSKSQQKKLWELHKRTNAISYDLYIKSAKIVMEDASESLEEIRQITRKIEESYESLENVQKVINIATGVVVLGASIFSLSPQAIIDSIANLKEAIEE